MKIYFSKFIILSLIFPYFAYSMEMVSQDRYQEFRAQHSQVFNEYKKITDAKKELQRGIQEKNLSNKKFQEFMNLQNIQLNQLKKKIKKVLEDYEDFSDTSEYMTLGILDDLLRKFTSR